MLLHLCVHELNLLMKWFPLYPVPQWDDKSSLLEWRGHHER